MGDRLDDAGGDRRRILVRGRDVRPGPAPPGSPPAGRGDRSRGSDALPAHRHRMGHAPGGRGGAGPAAGHAREPRHRRLGHHRRTGHGLDRQPSGGRVAARRRRRHRGAHHRVRRTRGRGGIGVGHPPPPPPGPEAGTGHHPPPGCRDRWDGGGRQHPQPQPPGREVRHRRARAACGRRRGTQGLGRRRRRRGGIGTGLRGRHDRRAVRGARPRARARTRHRPRGGRARNAALPRRDPRRPRRRRSRGSADRHGSPPAPRRHRRARLPRAPDLAARLRRSRERDGLRHARQGGTPVRPHGAHLRRDHRGHGRAGHRPGPRRGRLRVRGRHRGARAPDAAGHGRLRSLRPQPHRGRLPHRRRLLQLLARRGPGVPDARRLRHRRPPVRAGAVRPRPDPDDRGRGTDATRPRGHPRTARADPRPRPAARRPDRGEPRRQRRHWTSRSIRTAPRRWTR